MKGEHVVNLVGSLILTRVHRFALNFPCARIFERFGDNTDGRAAEETARAAVAGVVAQLLQWVSHRARALSPQTFSFCSFVPAFC
jgi:hypothetical protein